MGCPEDKEGFGAWGKGCVRVKAVFSGLWEPEVQVTGLRLAGGSLASNLALPSQHSAAGEEATLRFCALVICLDRI